MTERRQLLSLAALLLAAGPAWPGAPLPRIGVAEFIAFVPTKDNPVHGIVPALRQFDLVEGRDYEIMFRSSKGDYQRNHSVAKELVDMKVDVIVTGTSGIVIEAAKLTSTIPIVFVNMPDPIGMGVVSNLSRPGGNITGTSAGSDLINDKQCELMALVVPGLRRMALLIDAKNGLTDMVKVFEPPSRRLGIHLVPFRVRSLADIEQAFIAMRKQRIQAALIVQDRFMWDHAAEIVRFAIREGIPVASRAREFAAAGALFAYGEVAEEGRQGAARYVAKILRGAKPGELPIQQPLQFTLVFNRKTANTLKLALPQSLALRADEVIE